MDATAFRLIKIQDCFVTGMTLSSHSNIGAIAVPASTGTFIQALIGVASPSAAPMESN